MFNVRNIFGLVGKDCVLLANEVPLSGSGYINTEETIYPILDSTVLSLFGNMTDNSKLLSLIRANLSLVNFEGCPQQNTTQVSYFIRSMICDLSRLEKVAEVNALVAGFDKPSKKPLLFFIDAIGNAKDVPYACFGANPMYIYGAIDYLYKKESSREELYKLVEHMARQVAGRNEVDHYSITIITAEEIKKMPHIRPQAQQIS